jgi:L-alanine-DL-glutamate epimerase-like enolase superfamily enzyme
MHAQREAPLGQALSMMSLTEADERPRVNAPDADPSRHGADLHGPTVDGLEARIFTVPTEQPESDGTLAWASTTMVLVEVTSGQTRGLGYSYADATAAQLIRDRLADEVRGAPLMDVSAAWWRMVEALRNVGRPGIGMTAVSAVDVALWDLKAKVLGLPLDRLLGRVREAVPIYGSGGFTSLSIDELGAQLSGWTDQGIRAVKMKVGREPGADPERVRAARAAIGPEPTLMVDANGAYDRKQASRLAWDFVASDVRWFEEPVSSDDLEGLRALRADVPPSMEIATGEYGYDAIDFVRLLDGAVDVLQADATRCGGITGFMRVAALCEARSMPLSTHTAPALHAGLGCAARPVRHLEYFHDHVRLEAQLFDGVPRVRNGALQPDPQRPGLGLALREADARQYELGPTA